MVEMAVVVLIIGLLMIPVIQIYSNYQKGQEEKTTRDNISIINAQISTYLTLTGHYPCPAKRDLPSTDPQYGKALNGTCDPGALFIPKGTCALGICWLYGTRDTNGDGTNELIVEGAVPFRELREINQSVFPDSAAFDAWGNQLTYVVTQSQAQYASSYKMDGGVIGAQDEFGQPTAGMNNDAHYVLISHGSDGKGAYTREGQLYSDCLTGNSGKDWGNCNDDFSNGVFISARTNNASGFRHFDDIVSFTKSKSSKLWDYMIDSSGNLSANIRNLNTDNVGVNNENPTSKLDVLGTPGNQGVIAVDNNVLAKDLCNKDKTFCFPLDAIAGSGFDCPAGQVLKGFWATKNTSGPQPTWDLNKNCASPIITIPNTQSDCPAGQYLHGIWSDGGLICR